MKNRKSKYQTYKQKICEEINSIYHETSGRFEHRNMKIFLSRKGVNLSKTTLHKYMNRLLGLTSIVRRKKYKCIKGHAHKTFQNLLKKHFNIDSKNKIWCTDFTYFFL